MRFIEERRRKSRECFGDATVVAPVGETSHERLSKKARSTLFMYTVLLDM